MSFNEKVPDLPRHKEALISQLFGEFIGFLKAQNLTDGVEFAHQTKPILQCSLKVIWIDKLSETHRITIALKSLDCLVEYAVLTQDKNILKRKTIKDLRYKLSSGSQLELIDVHQKQFDELFAEFKEDFQKLKENKL